MVVGLCHDARPGLDIKALEELIFVLLEGEIQQNNKQNKLLFGD